MTCVASGISPTSSRNSVPSSASSNRPSRRSAAPVKDPFSCPNNSDSSSVSGSAEQLTAMNGLSRRGESWCMACATNSLPVQDSPSISSVLVTGGVSVGGEVLGDSWRYVPPPPPVAAP